MLRYRDKLLITGGLLIGFGVGLCVGAAFFLLAMLTMFHHMFIADMARWSALITPALVPLAFIACGALVLGRGRRIP